MIPHYLTPLAAFESAEVVQAPRPKEHDDQQKTESFTGNNFPGWIVDVEIIRGQSEKRLPNGKEMIVLDTEIIPVTIWSDVKPSCSPGDYISFSNLMVGSYNSKSYFQALDITYFNEFSLEDK